MLISSGVHFVPFCIAQFLNFSPGWTCVSTIFTTRNASVTPSFQTQTPQSKDRRKKMLTPHCDSNSKTAPSSSWENQGLEEQRSTKHMLGLLKFRSLHHSDTSIAISPSKFAGLNGLLVVESCSAFLSPVFSPLSRVRECLHTAGPH